MPFALYMEFSRHSFQGVSNTESADRVTRNNRLYALILVKRRLPNLTLSANCMTKYDIIEPGS